MENSRKEILEELIHSAAELRTKLEELERRINEYSELIENKDNANIEPSNSEIIDIGNIDFLGDIPSVADEAHEEDTPEAGTPVPEDLPEGDGFSEDLPEEKDNADFLFGGFPDEAAPAKGRKGQTSPKNLNDANSAKAAKAVIDMKGDKPQWYSDIPGPEVKDVRSAISLNDRVMFISTLFREDSMLFQDTVGKINGMPSLDKAVSYLEANFPEWNMFSDSVYRFMMAVRRKIR